MNSFSLKAFFKTLGFDERAADLWIHDWPRFFIALGIVLIVVNTSWTLWNARQEREAQRILDEHND